MDVPRIVNYDPTSVLVPNVNREFKKERVVTGGHKSTPT